MMEIVDILLVFGLGWMVGTLILKYRIWLALSSSQEYISTDERVFLRLRTEYHNGSIFVYDTVTAMFVAQGSTVDEVVDKLTKQCIELAHVVHGSDEFWVIDGKVRRKQ